MKELSNHVVQDHCCSHDVPNPSLYTWLNDTPPSNCTWNKPCKTECGFSQMVADLMACNMFIEGTKVRPEIVKESNKSSVCGSPDDDDVELRV